MKDFVQEINHQFYNFVLQYDVSNDNIIRKIIHTNTVADTCFLIACKLRLSQNDKMLAYLTGILHDIGRFEQWKLYKTYNDKASVDHGDLSYELTQKFDLSMINPSDLETVKMAIKYHTKQYFGTDERVKLFNAIIISADAYANILNTANGAQRMTANEDGVSPDLLADFLNQKPLWKYSPKTKLDRALLLTARTYYVRFDFLRKQIIESNLIDAIKDNFLPYFNQQDKKTYCDAVEILKTRLLDCKFMNNFNQNN